MMTGIGGIGSRLGAGEAPAASGRGGEGFAAALREAVDQVSALHQQSQAEVRRLLTGESEDLHRTLLAVQRAELAFEMMLEVRNKAVQAYQEIMRMQV